MVAKEIVIVSVGVSSYDNESLHITKYKAPEDNFMISDLKETILSNNYEPF